MRYRGIYEIRRPEPVLEVSRHRGYDVEQTGQCIIPQVHLFDVLNRSNKSYHSGSLFTKEIRIVTLVEDTMPIFLVNRVPGQYASILDRLTSILLSESILSISALSDYEAGCTGFPTVVRL